MKIDWRPLAATAPTLLALSTLVSAAPGKAEEPFPQEISASVVDAPAVISEALAQAGSQHFDEALLTLGQLHEASAHSLAARLARGRILSWAGRHDEAAEIFTALERDFPQDADVQIGLASLSYYRKDFDNAEARFRAVLSAHPDYDEARIGLERVRAARVAVGVGVEARPLGWRLDGLVAVSCRSLISLSHLGFERERANAAQI